MSTATEAVAARLIDFLREGKNVNAIETLYAEAIETIEADPARTRSGKDVVQKSMQDFADGHSFHYTTIEGPLVSGDNFVLHLAFEATNRATNQSFAIDEIGVYTVRDEQIVREQFFYAIA